MARQKRESNHITKVFADRLSDLVEEKKKEGFTQKEIAAGIGVSSGILSEWCSDNKTPLLDALPKIAEYFCVSVDWLIGCSNVRATNTSFQQIHHVTALSEKSISRLKVDNDLKDNRYISFLNRVIESDYLQSIAKLAALYANVGMDEYIRLDMIPLTDSLEDYNFEASSFIKALLMDYFFKVIEKK